MQIEELTIYNLNKTCFKMKKYGFTNLRAFAIIIIILQKGKNSI